jgi:hypothetical protein
MKDAWDLELKKKEKKETCDERGEHLLFTEQQMKKKKK